MRAYQKHRSQSDTRDNQTIVDNNTIASGRNIRQSIVTGMTSKKEPQIKIKENNNKSRKKNTHTIKQNNAIAINNSKCARSGNQPKDSKINEKLKLRNQVNH